MRQYFRLIALFLETSIASELEYRANFLLATLSSLGNLSGSIFGLYLFYGGDVNRSGFDGWSWLEALMVLGVFTLFQGISSTLLAPNLNQIVKHVEAGTLDFVLLKPVSAQVWLSSHRVSPWGVPDILLGIGTIFYSGSRLNLPPVVYISSLLPIAAGILILYSLWFMLGTTSIWFTKIYNVTEVLRGFLEAGRFPIAAYPGFYRLFFTFVVPVTFLTTVPAEAILGRSSLTSFIGALLLAPALVLLSNRFWRFALRSYTSASS